MYQKYTTYIITELKIFRYFSDRLIKTFLFQFHANRPASQRQCRFYCRPRPHKKISNQISRMAAGGNYLTQHIRRFLTGMFAGVILHRPVRPDIRIRNSCRYGKITPQGFVLFQQAGISWIIPAPLFLHLSGAHTLSFIITRDVFRGISTPI